MSELARTFFFVIDGIEECSKDAQRAFFRVLRRLPSCSSATVTSFKIFLSGRGNMSTVFFSSYESTFRQAVSEMHTDADIAAFVEDTLRQKIDDGDLAVGSQDLVGEIQRTLVSQADGM